MKSSAMTHLEYLAVKIGARGSTTPEERDAARYAKEEFESLGLETHWEEFTSPTTGWRPYSIASFFGLISVVAVYFGGPIAAGISGILMLVTTVSVLLELNFQPNLLRVLVPKGKSQNIWARIPSKRPSNKRILITGHVDTHRTPWVFTTIKRINFLRIVTTLGTISFVLSTIFFFILVFVDIPALRWLFLIFVLIYLTVLVITWQPDRTPFTQGANDNASGTAIVISLAKIIAQEPLLNFEVWVLCTGSEEVGSYGAQDFIKRHKSELQDNYVINIDNVGGSGAGVCYTSTEGMIFPLKPSSELFSLANQINAENPEFNAYTLPFTTLNTDGTCFMINRIPTLSFVGLTPEGMIPNWHQVTDTFEHVDATSVENTESFILKLLGQIDHQGNPS